MQSTERHEYESMRFKTRAKTLLASFFTATSTPESTFTVLVVVVVGGRVGSRGVASLTEHKFATTVAALKELQCLLNRGASCELYLCDADAVVRVFHWHVQVLNLPTREKGPTQSCPVHLRRRVLDVKLEL